MEKGCKIVTIKEIFSLYKGEEMANMIELVSLEEIGNYIVAPKGVYKTGDKALFIQPDFCLSDIPLFQEYICPGGDPKKCRLGSKFRVRAIKFNLHTGNNAPVYSYGILIKENDLKSHGFPFWEITDEKLGIVKWEEPEIFHGGKSISSPFPNEMYQTDEVNINNIVNDIKFPVLLIGTEKCDGSSFTVWYKNGKSGIASRKMGRPLTYKKITGRKKPNIFFQFLKFFGYKYDGRIIEVVESDDNFAIVGKPLLEILIGYCRNKGCNIALRGELVGKGCKGSGNRNNPKAKEENHVEFFGVDDYTRNTVKLEYDKARSIIEEMGLQFVKEYFRKTFDNKEEIFSACQQIFDEEEKNGRIIEGVVLRNPSGTFSTKVMNMLYDSKK